MGEGQPGCHYGDKGHSDVVKIIAGLLLESSGTFADLS